MQQFQKKSDLTGQQFGMLTAIAPAGNINGRTAWLCHCSCGRETVVKTTHLRSGHTESCGCLLGDNEADRAGKQYGRSPEQMRRLRERLTYIDGTCVEMLAARTVRRNNTSGVPGVCWYARKERWQAAICFQGKRYCLGYYRCFEDAVKARKQAEAELFDSFLQQAIKEKTGKK